MAWAGGQMEVLSCGLRFVVQVQQGGWFGFQTYQTDEPRAFGQMTMETKG